MLLCPAGVLWAFSALMGLSLASIFRALTGPLIARAFFGAAAMFAGLSLYGHITRGTARRSSTALW